MKTQTFLIRCEYPDGDHIPTQEFVENIQEYFAANIMDGERGRLVVKPVYQPKEEGLVEDETLIERVDDKGLPFNEWLSHKGSFHVPDGYELKDENGNVINATKIVLEKKKKEYPKTYCECKDVLGLWDIDDTERGYYKTDLIDKLQMLLICRDAYWKIAGEEMGLGKPWEPDWNIYEHKFCLGTDKDKVIEECVTTGNRILAFPTKEMRDNFKKNFDPDLEICKELL